MEISTLGVQFGYVKILASIALLGIAGLLGRLYGALVANPRRLRAMLTKQGIRGPPPSFLLGNIKEIRKARSSSSVVELDAPVGEAPAEHRCSEVLFPFFEKWRKQYGQVFLFSLGHTQILYVNQPEVVKEITTCTSLAFGKPLYQFKERGPLLGQGILTSNGAVWAHQRKIIAPQLYMDKVKGMINLIVESVDILVDSWGSRIDAEGGTSDIKIDSDMRSFSGDVISRACFGSNFSKGKEIFRKLRSLQEVLHKKIFLAGVPGMRYIPTKSNRQVWTLESEVAKLILKVVKERREAGEYKKDLLQMLLEASQPEITGGGGEDDAADRFIVDNCKNIYLAGYETTATAATWCLMLLAANPHWQERARAEVLQLCGGGGGRSLDYDMLLKMKHLTTVIYEVLRLYPPVTVVSREALKDLKFGGINVPKGTSIWTMVVSLHTEPEIWGPDAYEFKPERFANGIVGACKLPHLYMPFGVGPRVCLGQNLAIVELKMLLALILSNFSFSLSPKYCHAPDLRLVVEPKYGVDLLMTRLIM